MIEYHIRTEGSCERLDDLPRGAVIDAVDDRNCIGRCESCGIPILEGDQHTSDEEGVMLCQSCADEERAFYDEEERRRVAEDLPE